MRNTDTSRRNRAGFTLVELLVVMVIIGLLVSLVAAAVMRGIVEGTVTQTRVEIGKLEQGIVAFMTEFNVDYIPSFMVLREDGQYQVTGPTARQSHKDTVAYLQKMFGKNFNPATPCDWNGNGKIDPGADLPLQGQNCLVFLLGGVATPTAPFACQGFSTNSANPAAQPVTGEKRRGPFYQFQTTRLVPQQVAALPTSPPTPVSFLTYLDPWKTQPYAFFSSYKTLNGYFTGKRGTSTFPGDCPSLQVAPYFRLSGTTTVFENGQSVQIISSGRDGLFDQGGQWDPVTGKRGVGEDDHSNFSRTPLGNPP